MIEVLQFILAPRGEDLAKIFLLTGPAGAGKSAMAHTVAQRCHEMGILASSFFFSRDYRDRPRRLFSSIARALATYDKELRQEIGLAIERDESLPTAPLSRQFQDLILTPTSKYPLGKPCVIVIDAFDESFDDQSSNPREQYFATRFPSCPQGSALCSLPVKDTGLAPCRARLMSPRGELILTSRRTWTT